MGLNFALLNFLIHSETFQKPSGSTDKRILEIGRLKNSMSKKQKKLISRKYSIPYEVVNSDPHAIYRYFGFKTINTLDIDNFEGADVIVNLNLIPERNKYFEYFDLVIDGGTSEHIYNPLIALANYFSLLSKDGHLIQFVPVHNYIDHGLYQFSPTFFWSINTKSIQLDKFHLSYRHKKQNRYFDGLDDLVKAHLFKLYDGSAMVNLFRFTSKTVVGLTKWSKKDNLDLVEFIFNSNQEIYRKKWNNDEILFKLSFNHKILRFFISFVYKSNFTLFKYFFARIILRLNEHNYF